MKLFEVLVLLSAVLDACSTCSYMIGCHCKQHDGHAPYDLARLVRIEHDDHTPELQFYSTTTTPAALIVIKCDFLLVQVEFK